MVEKRQITARKANIVFRKAQMTIDHQMAPHMRQFGITHSQFGVLDWLYSKGEQKVGEILTGLLATSGNMTVVLKNMEKKGWIYRRVCPDDKRANLIGLTADGRDLFEQVLPEHLEQVERIMSIFTESEQEQLISLLKKFKDL